MAGRQDLLPDDSALYPGFFADDPRQICLQHGFLADHVPPDNGRTGTESEIYSNVHVERFRYLHRDLHADGRCDTADLPPAG